MTENKGTSGQSKHNSPHWVKSTDPDDNDSRPETLRDCNIAPNGQISVCAAGEMIASQKSLHDVVAYLLPDLGWANHRETETATVGSRGA